MKRNSRMALAIHTLSHMAENPERVRTSSDIADHVGTNPVVVRRVLGRLKKAGMLISEKGHAGGWRLAQPPQSMTLADVYLALDERLISVDKNDHVSECAVEHALYQKTTTIMQEIEKSLIERLRKITIFEMRGSD